MHPLNWAIVIVYLVYVVVDGLRRAKGTTEIEGYFLANRSLPWWAVGLSVMATNTESAMADTITRTAESCDNTRYGRVLPMINAGVEIGDIRICSMVPCSFSRTIESAVETTAVIIEI